MINNNIFKRPRKKTFNYVVLFGFLGLSLTSPVYADDCKTSIETLTKNKSVKLLSINCKNLYGKPQRIHVLDTNLNDKGIKIIPLQGGDEQLHTLPVIAKQNSHIIAGVNASFFYFNPKNKPDYFDEICPTKTYPQRGSLGNSLMQYGGKSISTNCKNNFNGAGEYARSVLGINENGSPFIQLLSPGTPLKINGKIIDAVGGGPNLVSSDIEGKHYVNIGMEGFGQWLTVTSSNDSKIKEYYSVPETVNVVDKLGWSFDVAAPNGAKLNMHYHVAAAFYGKAPRTAVGLRKDNHLFLVAVDGGDPTCGLIKMNTDPVRSSFRELSSLLKDENAIILFNNELYYANPNKQDVRNVAVIESNKDNYKTLITKFTDSYKLADAGELKIIEAVTGDVLERKGMTLHQLATFMIDYLHVDNAMNLDGGGSTTMYIPGHLPEVVTWNAASLREVFNGLFIVRND